ncbi:tyrosine-type recombinase/integrase [Vibrio coralliilyticus]|uniref:tyrosine-type recombinase/integrase n=1 Tax=Vibrio coralliilyticus TaxID=190893 RepID=UPI001857C274|nr:tyrosine-type recombinase/integrase [Vibrio coralliilyticus]NUW66917.1 tyrosine-type recombinase/integrase [Vibrio coralliilyticus]
MAARPRKYQQHVENLYQKTDKRNGKTYFTYKHPETGQFIGLGSDREKAFSAAREANAIFAERKVEQIHRILQMDKEAVKVIGISARAWVERYQKIQHDRMIDGDIKPTTLKNKTSLSSLFSDTFGGRGIKEITTKDIVDVLEQYKAAGKSGMASTIKSVWGDLFKEAQYAGEVEPGFNPVIHTRSVKLTTQRRRITEHDLSQIMDAKTYQQRPYLKSAIKIAVTTGLRISDIAELKFSDVKKGHLYVTLGKSNGKMHLAFPLSLANPFINETLGDIIKECRSTRIVSRYLIHVTTANSRTQKGAKVTTQTISKAFLKAKRECANEVSSGTFTFHELRSFAERIYRASGYDTQALLGHQSPFMTDKYNDDRKPKYVYIVIPNAAN